MSSFFGRFSWRLRVLLLSGVVLVTPTAPAALRRRGGYLSARTIYRLITTVTRRNRVLVASVPGPRFSTLVYRRGRRRLVVIYPHNIPSQVMSS